VGSWGAGLYSGDFALDLRSTVAAVARLPFDADRLTDIVCDTESAAAHDPANDDHTTFWLVLADQAARRGILSAKAREMAMRIIDTDRDLETQRRLGQSGAGLAKRRRQLVELRARLLDSPAARRRATLREPQRFLMDVGDALIYPTCGGHCRNPYTSRPDQLMIYGTRGGAPWVQDGWGAIVVIERGRSFGFFAWYRPAVITATASAAPDLEGLRAAEWRLELPGTCSSVHFHRMQLQKVGEFPIEPDRVREVFPGLRPGDSAALSDISIANRMQVWSAGKGFQPRRGVYARLIQIGELGPSAL
jgi:hypothetical protein